MAGVYGGISFPFLTSSSPKKISLCNSVPVEITFTKPVRELTIIFAGAGQKYLLMAYDTNNIQISSSEIEAVFMGGLFEIGFRSKSANISRITFGRQHSFTAIKEITYNR